MTDAPLNAKQISAKEKLSKIPIKIVKSQNSERLRMPKWLYSSLPKVSERAPIDQVKQKLTTKRLHSVCEEASCPNLPECFGKGTATFMIMGDICTRRCSFCDVKHGRPAPLDIDEPKHLAESVKEMGLNYVVITSVDRDDLKDGGAHHFVECIKTVRQMNPGIKIEVLTPDFRVKNSIDIALDLFTKIPPDVFNHNIETVPDLYKQVRHGAIYGFSLKLLREYKAKNSHILTKSGLMLGLGETNAQVIKTLQDLRENNVDMLTLGQYLQPTNYHIKVARYVHPDEFTELGAKARDLGFSHVASGPLVRSSYHADLQFSDQSVG